MGSPFRVFFFQEVSPLSKPRIEALGGGIVSVISNAHGFGTDAMLLADFAAPKNRGPVLDMGTGCGILPLLWKRDGATQDLYGLELQPAAVDQFREAVRLNEENGIDMGNVHPLLGDLREIEAMDLPLGQFRTVTMNPPYKPAGTGILSEDDAEQIARHETACTMEDAAKAAAKALNYGGSFFLCHRPERLPDVFEALRRYGIEPKQLRFVQKRPETAPWLFLLEGRKGGKAYLNVLPPLFIQKEDGSPTEELKRVLGAYSHDE